MGVGALPLFCRGTALRRRDDDSRHPLQEDGHLQYGHRPLYRLALPAVGHQALLEPDGRSRPHQAVVDRHHAGGPRHRLRGHRLLHPRTVFLPAHAGVLLAGGLHVGHPRHRGRRLLHARPRQPRAVVLRRHTQHVLSHLHHSGTRTARHHRGTDRGPYGQDTALLDGGLRHPLHPLLPREPLPRLGAPQACLRPPRPRPHGGWHPARVAADVPFFLHEEEHRPRPALHVALPTARGAARQDHQPLPPRPDSEGRTRPLDQHGGHRLWHGGHHRTDLGWHPRWHRCLARGTETLALADGLRHHAPRPRLCLSRLRPGQRAMDRQHLRLHRAVWLRIWLHGLHALPHLFLGGRAQHVPLRHQHGLHGPGNDAAGHDGRMAAGTHRLPPLLPLDDPLLRGNVCRLPLHQDRP